MMPANDNHRYFLRRHEDIGIAVAFLIGAMFAQLLVSSFEANAKSILRSENTGTAKIVDGDTIEIGGKRIRLHGIDAPEAAQKCEKRGGGNWACGKKAINAIAKLADGKLVKCVGDKVGGYGRLIAVCSVGNVEINREMVKLGLAWNFDKFSMDYKDDEKIVRKAGLGVFQAATETPWEYRANKWVFAVQKAPKGCAIKGNISSNGKIYHTPWSRDYKRTKITLEKGERWFCDEAAAIKAGWRAPVWH